MPWTTDANGLQTWVPDTGGVTSTPSAPLTNPNPNRTALPQTQAPATVQVPASTNIDANAGVNNASAVPAPVATGLGPPQAQGPNPSGTAGQYTVQQILAPFDAEFDAAN